MNYVLLYRDELLHSNTSDLKPSCYKRFFTNVKAQWQSQFCTSNSHWQMPRMYVNGIHEGDVGGESRAVFSQLLSQLSSSLNVAGKYYWSDRFALNCYFHFAHTLTTACHQTHSMPRTPSLIYQKISPLSAASIKKFILAQTKFLSWLSRKWKQIDKIRVHQVQTAAK